ncbi:MAG: ISAs1 family transposase [Ardenticatenaceae bacterium]|nr:ISAs1 family transposase [Ardenticatenaceae bacterium]MCB9419261.1 ISAs1 family transposase [Ardenticatenaceae bacterium]MCB9419694.1 ISAs1 family transposase [Ardenticatenaceae bacterium]MCB9421846.1 ISAs1 family transposase [Ardenticatenaceae bacterium]MCB9421977.1 ISAs1 family transposase [Ardenticatenaceae bacterium]
MQHIILEAHHTKDGLVFNVTDLEARLNQLTDSRDRRGKIYPLGTILTMIILAKLAGEDKPSGIAQWIRLRCDAFVRIFCRKHKRMPCLNTIRTVLQDVVPLDELETLFRRYLHDAYGGQESRLITIDGKTMRGTIPKGSRQGVHLLAAYLPEEGVVLKQVAVATKENEINAAPQLLEGINIKNKVICADAMQTQRKLSVDVLSRGGDYIWFLKDNQPTLLEDVKQFFKPARMSAGWHPPELPRTVAKTTEIGHGRLEKRTLTLMVDEEQFLDWPGVHQVFQLERETTHLRTGRETTELAYGITSCTPEITSAKQMLQWTRQYWGIENGLHYRRDVTLREDATRISQPALAKTMSAINNFVVGLTQKMGYSNLAAARRLFDAKIAAQLS